jgi:hypothetical protein
MAVPRWPLPAFCAASVASVRIVSTTSPSQLLLGTIASRWCDTAPHRPGTVGSVCPVEDLVRHADQQRLFDRLDLVDRAGYQEAVSIEAVSIALTPPTRPTTRASMSVEPDQPR